MYNALCARPQRSVKVALTVFSNPNLTVDGRLNKQKILERHPLLAQYFDDGIEIITWKYEAEELWPGLPDLAQRALNAKHSIQTGTDQFQCYIRACRQWSQDQKQTSSQIKADIMGGNPMASDEQLTHIVEIARKWGGSLTIIDSVEDFLAAFMVPGAKMTTDMLKKLANTKQSPSMGEVCPLFVNSIIMTMAAAPSKSLVPTATDVAGIMSEHNGNIENMKLIEKTIATLFSSAQAMSISNKVANRLINDYRVQCIMKFFKKQKELTESYHYYAHECFQKLLAFAATDAQVPSPFEVTSPDPSTDESKSPKKNKASGSASKSSQKTAVNDAVNNAVDDAADTAIKYDGNMNVVGFSIKAILDKHGIDIDVVMKNRKSGQTFIVN